MSLLLTRMGGRAGWDRRGNPSFVIDVARGGLSDMVRGAAITFTRASAAWAFDSSGVLRQYASGVPRIVPSPVGVMSALREPQRTNKCTNYNANPNGSLTNMTKGGDAAATLTEVDDSAALAAAGLSTVCSSGKVFKLDNSAGVAIAYVDAYGATGNTNDHTLSAYMRGSGTAYLRTGSTLTNDWGPVTLTSSYARIVSRQGSGLAGGSKNSADVLRVVAHPGSVVYFILNQLEEGAGETSPIVVAGSAVTRVRDEISIATSVGAGQPFSEFIDFVAPWVQSVGSTRLCGYSGGIGWNVETNRVLSSYNGAVGIFGANTLALNARAKGAHGMDGTGRAFALNGGSVTSDTNTWPAFSSVLLGQNTAGSDATAAAIYIHGYRQFPTRLTNAQLQALTS